MLHRIRALAVNFPTASKQGSQQMPAYNCKAHNVKDVQ